MPKVFKDVHEGIPYHYVPEGKDRGCYQLHKPYDCKHKFPVNNKNIHKCEAPQREYTMVQQGDGYRALLIPRPGKNLYPAVMHKSEYERLKKQAKIVTQEEIIEQLGIQEKAIAKAAKESEERKNNLKTNLRPQPGTEMAADPIDPELAGPDQSEHTLNRAKVLKADELPGLRLCNRVILATKCHAIRDAQVAEKELIKRELAEEERRLDAIMEENRLAAEKRAEDEENRRQSLQQSNLSALKEQIRAHEVAKVMEAERIEEESIRLNQANIAMQLEEARKQRNKYEEQVKLKEILDKGNAELLYFKQLQEEEDRIMDLRIKNFVRKKHEFEAKAKADANAIKAAKQKGIDHISKAQKAEHELKEELERIRNLKIQEDVERGYRRREREAAIKRNQDMHALHVARMNQIKDIHRAIAREIAKDEQSFNNVARQNEESLMKDRANEEKRKKEIEKHRQAIMKQINDKERERAEMREKIQNEGVALRLEQQGEAAYEKQVIKEKVNTMRKQKIQEKYVTEVEQILGKLGYL